MPTKHVAHVQELTPVDVQRMKSALSIIKLHEGFGVPLFRPDREPLTVEEKQAKRHRYKANLRARKAWEAAHA